MNFDLKKIGLPLVMMLITIGGGVCEFVTSINEKSLEEQIDEKVNERFEEYLKKD